jgi:hypothetical protein
MRKREREIIFKESNGGKACGGIENDQPCSLTPCPVDCTISDWSAWHACKTTCGSAQTTFRERVVVVASKHGGNLCPKEVKQTKDCGNPANCPIDCTMTLWSGWHHCSKTCGGGKQLRTRYPIQEAKFGGKKCPDQKDSRACNSVKCPVDCQMSDWTKWGACSRSCKCLYCHANVGSKKRTRSVVSKAALGGKACATTDEKKECNTQMCPHDCTTTAWSNFGACDKTCGAGIKVRNRVVLNTASSGGKKCPSLQETKVCIAGNCAVDCVFTEWTPWSKCSITCDNHGVGGNQVRTRKITIEAAHGGKGCPHTEDRKLKCGTESCPGDCVVGMWSEWGACSKTCGKGISEKTRPVLTAPSAGGGTCPKLKDTKVCDTKTVCPAAFDPMSMMDMGGAADTDAPTKKPTVNHIEAAFDPMAMMASGFDPTKSPTKKPTAKAVEAFDPMAMMATAAATTKSPTAKPTATPTAKPTVKATEAAFNPNDMMGMMADPTPAPTIFRVLPTLAPTAKPTATPTAKPTDAPKEAAFDPMAMMATAAATTNSPTKKPTAKAVEAFDPMAMMATAAATTKSPTKAPTAKKEAAFDPMAMMATAAATTKSPTKAPTAKKEAAFDPMAMMGTAAATTKSPTKAPTAKKEAAFDPMAMMGTAAATTNSPTEAPTAKKEAAFDPMAMMGTAAVVTDTPTKAPTAKPTLKLKSKVFDPNAVGDMPSFDFDELAAMVGTDMQEGLDHTRSTANTPKPTPSPTSIPTASKVADDGIPDLAALMKMSGGSVAQSDTGKFGDFDSHTIAKKLGAGAKTEKDLKKKTATKAPTKAANDFSSIADMMSMASGGAFNPNEAAKATPSPTDKPTVKAADGGFDLSAMMGGTGGIATAATPAPTPKAKAKKELSLKERLDALQDDDPTNFGAYDDTGVIGGGTCMGGYIKDLDLYLDCKQMIGFMAIIASDENNVDKLSQLKKILASDDMKGPKGDGLTVKNNKKLKNLDGLNNLSLVAGGMTIEGNPALTTAKKVGTNLKQVGVNDKGESVNVKSNDKLEDFPGLDELIQGQIMGSLSITDNALLANIQGANAIKEVGGDVTVKNNKNLKETNFDSLEKVGGDLAIANNKALAKFAPGLKKVREIMGSILLEGLPSMTTFDGLENIEKVGKDSAGDSLKVLNNAVQTLTGLRGLFGLIQGAVKIAGNDNLKDLKGLENLRKIGKDLDGVSLKISENAVLKSLEGIDGLRGKLDGSVVVLMNPSLEKLAGLQHISEIASDKKGDSLRVEANDALKNLIGLDGLQKAEGAVEIKNNRNLKNLDGLQNMRTVSGKNKYGLSLVVIGNTGLEDAEALDHLNKLAGGISIKNNEKLSDVEAMTKGLSSASGLIEVKDVKCVSKKTSDFLSEMSGMSGGGGDVEDATTESSCTAKKVTKQKQTVGEGVGAICGGQGNKNWGTWEQFGSSGLYSKVDTTKCGFSQAHPNYQSSINGDSAHWQLTGVNSIYAAKATGFKVQIWHPILRGKFMKYFAERYNWSINWLADSGKSAGRTVDGATGWKKVAKTKNVVYVDVDTSKSEFPSCPRYVTSLHGASDHWKVQGVHAVYHPEKKHFRIFAIYPTEITAAEAEGRKWTISWTGSNDDRTSGNSNAGDWKAYKAIENGQSTKHDALYTDVDTKSGLYKKTPTYVTSVSGDSHHWSVTGAASIYAATKKSFRIYLDHAKSPVFAKKNKWHVNYIAYSEPVDCVLAKWGSWSKCSKTCGGGKKTRSRKIVSRAYFGGACGKTYESEEGCATKKCAVHCVMSEWMPWSKCSRTCGRGVRGRSRHILVEPKHNGNECDSLSEAEYCDAGNCPVHCIVSDWDEWRACSKTCGGGKRIHKRTVLKSAKHGGFVCPNLEGEGACNTNNCPIDCKLSAWSAWPSACSKTCGAGGKKHSSRSVITAAAYDGASCEVKTRSIDCDEGPCPIHCVTSEWGVWNDCDKSCGSSGKQRRLRTVQRHAKHGGYTCPALWEDQPCNRKPCPIDTVQSGWSEWGGCSTSCNGGMQTRTRSTITAAAYGGVGPSPASDLKNCNTQPCPEDCMVEDWSKWGACSKTCVAAGAPMGDAERERFIIMMPTYGGKACPDLKQTMKCSGEGLCPIHCKVSLWSEWDDCSKTCDRGNQKRSRTVLEHAMHGGYACPALTESQDCNIPSCPEDCIVSEFGFWEDCSHSCRVTENPTKLRKRSVIRKASHGGKACPNLKQVGNCNTQKCPEDCLQSDWTEWGKCSKTCVPIGGTKGEQYRTREILMPPNYGGKECGANKKFQDCDPGPCPIHCAVSAWDEWTVCDKSCKDAGGVGSQFRSRAVLTTPKHGGFVCPKLEEKRDCNSHECPINCVQSTFTGFGACTETCGGGKKEKKRTTLVFPKYGGKACGASVVEDNCNTQCCPVNCELSTWSGFGSCDKTCGAGNKKRTRSVISMRHCGGTVCMHKEDSESCTLGPCAIHCKVSDWSGYTKCSHSCNGGHKMKIRKITVHPEHGGYVCPALVQKDVCNDFSCPKDCIATDFSAYSTCSKTCGGGKHSRTREITQVNSHGGQPCVFGLVKSQTKDCETFKCPIDCAESTWSGFGSCSEQCGGGIQKSARSVVTQAAHGGAACRKLTSYKTCNTHPCPIDCAHSWKAWGECSKSCGGGIQTRTFDVDVAAAHGGDECPTEMDRVCNTMYCPTDCVVSGWTTFGECTKSCGTGTKAKSRSVAVDQKHGGKICPTLSTSAVCNDFMCPVDSVTGPWGGYTACSVTCGGGSQSRTRPLVKAATHGGLKHGELTQKKYCNLEKCPVDCKVSLWSKYQACSERCGGGTQHKTRTVVTPAQNNGVACPALLAHQQCNAHPCPTDCAHSWNSWGACDKSCGGGIQTRTFDVDAAAAHGGDECPTEMDRVCNTMYCPTDCAMSKWSGFGGCTKSCGTGTKTKSRTVVIKAANGGKACVASTFSAACSTFKCPIDCKVSSWGKYVNFKGGKGFMKRTRTIVTPAQYDGTACPKLAETKHWHETHDCKDDAVFGAWSECNKKCNTGHQYRMWEKVVCSRQSVLSYHIKFREGRQCNTFACAFDGDDGITAKKVPALKKHIVATEMVLDESISSWRSVSEKEHETYSLAAGSSWDVLA